MSFVLFIALAIAFFQQITGINAIFYYLPTIFAQAGGGTNAAFKQAVLVGLVNLGMTFVAIRFVDRLGRKTAAGHWRGGHGGVAADLQLGVSRFRLPADRKVVCRASGKQGARGPD